MTILASDSFTGTSGDSISSRAAAGGTWNAGALLYISDAGRLRSQSFQYESAVLSPNTPHTGNTLIAKWDAVWVSTASDTWAWMRFPTSAASPLAAYGVELKNDASDAINRVRLFTGDQGSPLGTDYALNPVANTTYSFELEGVYNASTGAMTLTVKLNGTVIIGPVTSTGYAGAGKHICATIGSNDAYPDRDTRGVHFDNIALDDGATATPALTVDAEPTTTASGYLITPPVVVRATTNGTTTDTAFTGNVTASLVGAGGQLFGTLTVAAVAGVATFNNLRPCVAGTYILEFTAAGYVLAESANFSVTTGAGATIVSRGFMNSRPTRRNESTASLRRMLLYIEDDAGAPWAGSVTGVKALLTVNGTLISSVETLAPTDIVRIAGGLHYTDVTQPYTDIAEGSFISARVPAATGRREAASASEIIPADSYAAAVSETSLVRSIIRAANGADGFGVVKDVAGGQVVLTIPGVGTINIPATFAQNSPAVVALG